MKGICESSEMTKVDILRKCFCCHLLQLVMALLPMALSMDSYNRPSLKCSVVLSMDVERFVN